MDDPGDDSLADNPVYRAGVLMGRQQSITDVIGLLLSPDGGDASDKVLALLNWCVQVQDEGKTELEMVVAELHGLEGE